MSDRFAPPGWPSTPQERAIDRMLAVEFAEPDRCCGRNGRVEINGTCWPRHDIAKRVDDVMYLCGVVETEGGDSISIAWLRARLDPFGRYTPQ